jgi:fumarylacetoacetase
VGRGTISGKTKESRGCLLELSWRGTELVALPGGEERRFLEDGDQVTLRARCQADGAIPIGFGECSGEVAPA